MSLLEADDVPDARSFCSTSSTRRPRPAASRAIPVPLMPPPMIARSKSAISADSPVLPHNGRPAQRTQEPRDLIARKATNIVTDCKTAPAWPYDSRWTHCAQRDSRRHIGPMPSPRLLVIEGNSPQTLNDHVAAGGIPAHQGYSNLLRELMPGAIVDSCQPGDTAAELPDGQSLEGYDGVAITGSSLHIYDGGAPVLRQIELVRAVLKAGTPLFGSCWGLQILTVAAGGGVRKNPKGRELGFGRGIRLTEAGRKHPMYIGKPDVFNAPTVHLDEVETLAPGTTVLATNAMSDVQSVEIRHNGAVAWGVQYHPEYPLREIAAIVRRIGTRLIAENFFAD